MHLNTMSVALVDGWTDVVDFFVAEMKLQSKVIFLMKDFKMLRRVLKILI